MGFRRACGITVKRAEYLFSALFFFLIWKQMIYVELKSIGKMWTDFEMLVTQTLLVK